MFGVAQFDAILPPGTGSILAIAASTPKVVQLKNGHFGKFSFWNDLSKNVKKNKNKCFLPEDPKFQ